MKKNVTKRVLALALTVAMLLGIAACGSSNNNSDSTATPTTAPTSAPATDPTTAPTTDDGAEADGWQPFAENVTLSVAVYDRGVEGVPTVDDNYWTKWVQENFGDQYNITVKYIPITRSDVMTDYALLASRQALPTILMEYDYDKVATWAGDGYLQSFDMEEFAKVAPTYYNKMVTNESLLYSTMNGETFFALAERPNWDSAYTFITFARLDWLKQVGYDSYPATNAEWFDAMQKIMDAGICEHPGGGALVTGVGSDQNYAFRTYPLNADEWAMYGDYAIPSLGWEPNKLLLKRENEKYNAGITNPEYYITDDETWKSQFINGECFSYQGYISSTMDWLTSFYDHNPDAELCIVPNGQVDVEGGTVPAYRADNPFGMIVGFSRTATEDELLAAWMYMEWMAQEETQFTMRWGVENETYTLGENGLPTSVVDYSGEYKLGYNNNKDYWCVSIESINAGTIEDTIASMAPQGLPQDFTQDIIDFYYGRKALSSQGYACNDCLFGVALESVSTYRGTLQETYKQYRDQLTMCSPEEFDALYDQLAAQYWEAGYKEVTEERLQAYQNGNTSQLKQ